jgi:hypothetical protein
MTGRMPVPRPPAGNPVPMGCIDRNAVTSAKHSGADDQCGKVKLAGLGKYGALAGYAALIPVCKIVGAPLIDDERRQRNAAVKESLLICGGCGMGFGSSSNCARSGSEGAMTVNQR